jgi:hypothetical protein
MHVGSLAIADLVGGRESDRAVLGEPDQKNCDALLDRPCLFNPEALAPVFRRRQTRGIDTERFQMFRG